MMTVVSASQGHHQVISKKLMMVKKVICNIIRAYLTAGMSNRGSPDGHMGHICVVMRATHDMPDIQYVFSVQNVFYPWK
jgi:hypothetical protein